jgi:hypothetical protein
VTLSVKELHRGSRATYRTTDNSVLRALEFRCGSISIGLILHRGDDRIVGGHVEAVDGDSLSNCVSSVREKQPSNNYRSSLREV